MINRIKTLYNKFSYGRESEFNKGRAYEKIKELLLNAGYQVGDIDKDSPTLETKCEAPEFIITVRYDSLYKLEKDTLDESTSLLAAALKLSETLNQYRKKVKFVFFHSEENEMLWLNNLNKSEANKNQFEIIKLSSDSEDIGKLFVKSEKINSSDKSNFEGKSSTEHGKECFDFEKISSLVELVNRYIADKLWN